MRGTVVYKMTGSGNDFVMLDGRGTEPDRWPATRVAAICDRRTGVGADGLVILTPDGPGKVTMAFWNSDGSRAAMCGNAALCSARLAVYLEMAPAGDLCRYLPSTRSASTPGSRQRSTSTNTCFEPITRLRPPAVADSGSNRRNSE